MKAGFTILPACSCFFLLLNVQQNTDTRTKKKPVPFYLGFRIYFTSNILYFFLVIPFMLFVVSQNPLSRWNGGVSGEVGEIVSDSVAAKQLDSLITESIRMGEQFEETGEMDLDSLLGESNIRSSISFCRIGNRFND